MKLTIKQQIKLSALIFITFCLFSAFIGWLSGYDFNARNSDVAFWVFMTVFLAAPLSAISFAI